MQAKTAVLAVSTLGFLAGGFVYKLAQPADRLALEHAPASFERRSGDLSANFCGRYVGAGPLRYRLNEAPWLDYDPRLVTNPRTPGDRFTLEFGSDDLVPGSNVVHLRAGDESRSLRFHYDDARVFLPREVDWRDAPLDVQDGAWERFENGDETFVRPVPGTEGYDRVINLTGAFEGARRIEFDVVFRRETEPGRLFGFGVLPLWGGHRDTDVLPRRGWRYGIAWYYSKQQGIGVETSDKLGGDDYTAATSYEKFALVEGTRYRVVSEAHREDDGWRLRMKWWAAEEAEPRDWIELDDHGKRLPHGEYSVALVAHRCQAEFGSVRIRRP